MLFVNPIRSLCWPDKNAQSYICKIRREILKKEILDLNKQKVIDEKNPALFIKNTKND